MTLTNDVKLRPLGNRVIVKPEKVEEVTKGGIVLPDTVSKERPQLGIIEAVGPGKFEDGKYQQMEVEVNQKVIYSKYAGTEIKLGDEERLILSENDILAIVSN